MSENKINELISTSLEKIRELSDTGTVIGEQIKTDSGVVIIPISKVSLGFVSGGIDLGEKKKDTSTRGDSFGGGGGTGLTVTPVGFLIIKPDGNVSMLNVTSPTVVKNDSTIAAVGDLLEKSPDIVRKFKELFAKDGNKADEAFTEKSE